MNSGMYAALSGNIAAQQRLDTLSNNLANVNTLGFKKDTLSFESVLADANNSTAPNAAAAAGPVMAGVTYGTDFSAGPMKQTGNTFDLALDGDGFFVVNTPQGRAYTRRGNFQLDSSGQLITADGYEVVGSGGPIRIAGSNVNIDGKGGVFVDGTQVGSLAVVDFPKPYQLRKASSSLFVPASPGVAEQPAAKTEVRQGTLEGSNVNPIQEMTNLIETSRYYESCIKAIQDYDNIAGKAANDLAKI